MGLAVPATRAETLELPNLTFNTYWWASRCGENGGFGNFGAAVMNTGSADSGPFYFAAILDNQYHFYYWASGIEAGQTHSVSTSNFATLELLPGTHTVNLMADPGNRVVESIEFDQEGDGTIEC
jgi:CARDB protein